MRSKRLRYIDTGALGSSAQRKHITNCTEYHAHRLETCPCSERCWCKESAGKTSVTHDEFHHTPRCNTGGCHD